ncbi:MAG: hypothetical protein JXP34_22860, partial [Planctomycetes bacterium]|nr:hypothetical protein [Planctomycetota bacterium]
MRRRSIWRRRAGRRWPAERVAPLSFVFIVIAGGTVFAVDPGDLALIPFPKEIAIEPGTPRAVLTEAGATSAKVEVRGGEHRIAIAAGEGGAPVDAGAPPESAEGYSLRVSEGGVSIRSKGPAGAFYGIQTLKQLIRGGAIPCLRIRDWPSLRWRGFADDITRGPSTLPAYLEREVLLAAESKQNFLSYYMEHQFAFRKHPEIGPEDGSLSAEELRALVAFAKPYHVEIIGNQQSFGHFGHILKHPEHAKLRETPDIISPAFPASYALLDDMLGEQIAALDAEFFNVCCDETFGLGTGPTKARAQKEGVGRVYADHIRKLHEIVRGKYKKRMMMWGDIILQHPE